MPGEGLPGQGAVGPARPRTLPPPDPPALLGFSRHTEAGAEHGPAWPEAATPVTERVALCGHSG